LPTLVTVTEPFGSDTSSSSEPLKDTAPSYFPKNKSLSAGSSSLLQELNAINEINNKLKILILVFIQFNLVNLNCFVYVTIEMPVNLPLTKINDFLCSIFCVFYLFEYLLLKHFLTF